MMVNSRTLLIDCAAPCSVGIDCEEVARFTSTPYERKSLFYDRWFTEKERRYCFSHPDPYRRLCGLFAAKEAVIKAVSGKLTDMKDIEIDCGADGKPTVRLLGSRAPRLRLALSICYARDAAVAVCLAYGDKRG